MTASCRRTCTTLLAATVLCTGCFLGLPEYFELRRLCARDAGFTVYQRVQADGYYSGSALSSGYVTAVVKGPFQWFEFCEKEPLHPRSLFEIGCYRLKKVPRESGLCYEPIERRYGKDFSWSSPESQQKYCISAEKIDHPTAKYGYFDRLDTWTKWNRQTHFMRSDAYIKELKTGTVIARYISYDYFMSGPLHGMHGCNQLGARYPSYPEEKLVETVLMSGK